MKNRVRILILLIAIILFVLIVRSTYSKFVQSAAGSLMTRVAEWMIKVNGVDVTVANEDGTPVNFLITNNDFKWNWDNVSHVKPPNVAPGMKGEFQLRIDADATQVSYEYDISIENPVIYINGEEVAVKLAIVGISIDKPSKNISIEEKDGKQYIKRIKPYSEIEQGDKLDTITVTVEWVDDGTNDLVDSLAGSDPNTVIKMPILFHAIQYTGN